MPDSDLTLLDADTGERSRLGFSRPAVVVTARSGPPDHHEAPPEEGSVALRPDPAIEGRNPKG